MYYFASDVHLGLSYGTSADRREALLVSWLDQVSVDADAIFLVGDIFDFWYEYKQVVPRGWTRLLGKLSELTDRGIPIHFFPGNHDLWTFDYLEKECGVVLHRTPYEVVKLYDKQVCIGHGDVLGKRDLIGRMLSWMFRSKIVVLPFGWVHPDWAIGFGKWWSRHNRTAKPVKHVFRAENEPIVAFARELMAERHIDLFVCGHIHCAELYPLSEETSIAFLGEWIERPVYGVLSKEGFELKDVQRKS